MSTTVALNRQRSSPLWWMLKTGSRIAGAVIVAATIVTLWAYTGNWAWTRFVSPTAEFIGVRAVQFAGKEIVAEPVQIAAINPATDSNTRLRNLDVELEQAIGRKP